MNEQEYVLKHHGILGQKWGIRRYQNEDGSLTPEGRERYSKQLSDEIKKENTNHEIENIAVDVFNQALPLINAQYSNGDVGKEYYEAIDSIWKEIYGSLLKEKYGDIANLLYDDEKEWIEQFIQYNRFKFLVEPDNNELKHWGILGMKWGIRNYQNPDGSLTPLGRLRYGVGPAKNTTGNVTGVNDANSLSDEELKRMTKRYRDQAQYYEARNAYIQQEKYFKQNIAPKPKGPSAVGRFLAKVFGQPIENYMAKNNEFFLNYATYALLGRMNPELGNAYMSSVFGSKFGAKNPVDKSKDEAAQARNQKNAVNDREEVERKRQAARNDLNKMRYDPNISAEMFKKAVNYYEKIFNEKYDPNAF